MDYIKLPQDNTPLVLLGDVMQGLKRIPSESVSCIVTSPPYWNLRDYYISGQIGQEKTPEEYITKMIEISNELLRVLKKDGAYFLNIATCAVRNYQGQWSKKYDTPVLPRWRGLGGGM